MADLQIMSFNAGVLTPLVDGRSDLEKYFSGLRVGDNMIPLPYGPAQRRPGTYFVTEIKDSTEKARLIPFQYSTEQAYILEYGDQYIRFYKDRGQIVYTDITFTADPSGDFAVGATMTGGTSEATAIIVAKISTRVYTIKYLQGTFEDETISCGDETVVCGTAPTTADSSTPVEITSDYLEADLFELQRAQSADVLYNVHGSYPQTKLSRYSHDHWSLEDIVFDWPPFLDENDTDITITPPTPPTDITGDAAAWDASSETGGYPPDNAFNDSVINDDGWIATDATDEWIEAEWAAAKTIVKIRIQNCQEIGNSNCGVRHCKVEASATGAWGGEEVEIAASGWTGECSQYNTDEILLNEVNNLNDWAEITLTNDTGYKFYRLICTDNYGGGTIRINEIEMMEALGDTYTASVPIFTSDHVGSYWLIKHPRTDEDGTHANSQSGTIAVSDTDGTTLTKVRGSFRIQILGDYQGEFVIERSYDEGTTWHTLETHNPTGTETYDVTGEEPSLDSYIRVATRTRVDGTLKYTVTVERYYHYGIIKITTVTDSTNVIATVIRAVGSTDATKLWSEGAWSDERGYPVAVAFFEGRLFYAGTSHKPLNIWGSIIDAYDNMDTGSKLDDEAVKFTVDSTTQNMIRWLVGQEVLLIGTSGGEWRLGSVDPADAITPSNPMRPRIQTSYGSKEIQALLLANAVLFVDAQGRRVRGAQYIFEKGEAGGYDAPDYTMLAEHITESGIVGMAYQQNPYPILWAWRDDGKMIGMVFEPGQKVWGWFPCVIDGDVESVAVIPGVTEDEVWIIVKRTINGSTKRYIEYFKPRDWGSDQADCFFVDSGLTFDGGAAVAITGITGAEPGVVTATNTFSNGDQVKIVGVVGMTDINNKVFTVASRAAGYFSLRDSLDTTDFDTTGYDAFASSITGDIEYDSYIITNVSAADIAKLAFGTTISGTGIPTSTTITAINDDSFEISNSATVTNTLVTLTARGTVMKVDNTFSGLDHLEGKTVSVLGDGSVHADVVVSDGVVTLTDYFNKVHIGLPFVSKLMPMKPAVPGANIRGKKKRIHQIIFSFYKTLGAKFGPTSGVDRIPFRKNTDPVGFAPPLFTGEKVQTWPSGYELNADIYVEQTQPLPMTVRSITAKLQVYG